MRPCCLDLPNIYFDLTLLDTLSGFADFADALKAHEGDADFAGMSQKFKDTIKVNMGAPERHFKYLI